MPSFYCSDKTKLLFAIVVFCSFAMCYQYIMIASKSGIPEYLFYAAVNNNTNLAQSKPDPHHLSDHQPNGNINGSSPSPTTRASASELHTHEDHKLDSELHLVQTIQNRYTKETINCTEKNRFKYFQMILQQLQSMYLYHSSKFNNDTKISTQYINEHIVRGGKFYVAPQVKSSQYLRIKFISGQLYLSKYQSSLSYRWGWWMYFYMRLFEKYGAFIPDTDFIIFMGDTGNMQFDYNRFPFFVGDGVEIEIENGKQLPLFTMPRSYIWLHQSPVEGYEYVSCYRDAARHFKFNVFEEKLDKAVFRGGASGGDWKTSKRGKVIVPSTDDNVTQFDAKYSCWRPGKSKTNSIPMRYCAEFTNTTHQMKYKYIILIDGNSVRDAYPKQLSIGSILLKQKSTFKEFWYYDLVDGYHMIEWNEYSDLKQLVMNLTEKVEPYSLEKQKEIGQNGRYFADHYLIDECMDCFVIQMIQLYNHYFFDSSSVELDPFDILINKASIKGLMEKGYKTHIYDDKFWCPVTNSNIVSQQL